MYCVLVLCVCCLTEIKYTVQTDVVTSTKALYKVVEACHLTTYLDGTLPYSHRDWRELHQVRR